MHSSVRFRVEPVMPADLLSRSLRDVRNHPDGCSELKVSGGNTARVTPVPIPNTEVKPRRADDTARVTVWERRSPPGLNYKGRSEQSERPFCFPGIPAQTCAVLS